MENNIIKIILNEKTEAVLTSNNPDIEAFIKMAVKNRDSIDIDKISIECESESFDNEGFLRIIKQTLKSLYSDIDINDEKLESALNSLT